MAWYAKIENNEVIEVSFIIDSLDSNWLFREYGGTWLRCTEDGTVRGIFPAVGFKYDRVKDEFFPPQPFNSWTYNEILKRWTTFVDCPPDGKRYKWNECGQEWVLSKSL